jgi:hypothetical protein
MPRSPLVSLVTALGLAAALPAAIAAGDPPAGSPPPPANPPPAAPPAGAPSVPLEDSLQRGARFFDQAIAWVARGGSLGKTRDFYASLDSKWDLDEHNEGAQKVWFQTPGRMRLENRFLAGNQVKVLDGDKAWTWDAADEQRVRRLHATPDAAEALKQLKEDFQRLQDLTDFVTLEGLKGPGVLFEFQGQVRGSKVYEGDWLKIARRSPDGRKITFWLAFETGPDGQPRATWPGVVRVAGDAAAGLFTEDWILRSWDPPAAASRPFRWPASVQAWRFPADKNTGSAQKFLTAVLNDVQVNQGVDAATFAPPAAPAAGGAGPR